MTELEFVTCVVNSPECEHMLSMILVGFMTLSLYAHD